MLNLIRQLFNFLWRSWLYVFGTLAGFGGFIYNLLGYSEDMPWYYIFGFFLIGIGSSYMVYIGWEGRDQDVADD